MSGFSKIAFTEAVKKLQERYGSRSSYARYEARDTGDAALGDDEARFIESRDSFFISSVTSDGWPYIQHRGGPRGFLSVLDRHHIAFADYGGNRQYITVGNLQTNDRVALILLDFPRGERLKLLGHARVAETADEPDLTKRLRLPEGYRARVERLIVVEVAGWDWNCNQHITPRYSLEEINAIVRDE